MTDWGDVVARARGLSGELLTPAQWRALCLARDVPALAAQLSTFGAIAPPASEVVAEPRVVESAVRRHAGARLRLLTRWAGDRASRVSPLFDDEDRRSLRAIVRGSAGGVPVDERSAGLIPTATLPIRAIDQLARSTDVAAVAAQLVAWRHPFAGAFAIEAQRPRPDLFRLEVAVTRAFAAHATAAAQRADAPMRLFVERTIDLENIWSIMALVDATSEVPAGTLFVVGGRLVLADDLLLAVRTHAWGAVQAAMRVRTAGTPLGAAFKPGARTREDAALDAMIAEFRRLALREPLSTAPVIAFVLRQRQEVRVILRVMWGIALGASRRVIERSIGVAA